MQHKPNCEYQGIHNDWLTKSISSNPGWKFCPSCGIELKERGVKEVIDEIIVTVLSPGYTHKVESLKAELLNLIKNK